MAKLMVFPSSDPDHIKVMQVPDDFEEHEIYRCATSIISAVQEGNRNCSWDEVEEGLEENGFKPVEFVLGPELRCK